MKGREMRTMNKRDDNQCEQVLGRPAVEERRKNEAMFGVDCGNEICEESKVQSTYHVQDRWNGKMVTKLSRY